MEKQIDLFIEMIKKGDFVEAHEVLEVSWKELKRSNQTEANIQKGLINGATAIALKIKGRDRGAYQVWDTYKKYQPLINETDSPYKEKYKESEIILEKMYQKYMV